jgi:hypothetical protein
MEARSEMCFITHICSPGEFYAANGDMDSECKKMRERLKMYYELHGESLRRTKTEVNGEKMVIFYKGIYQRAKVVDKVSQNRAKPTFYSRSSNVCIFRACFWWTRERRLTV